MPETPTDPAIRVRSEPDARWKQLSDRLAALEQENLRVRRLVGRLQEQLAEATRPSPTELARDDRLIREQNTQLARQGWLRVVVVGIAVPVVVAVLQAMPASYGINPVVVPPFPALVAPGDP